MERLGLPHFRLNLPPLFHREEGQALAEYMVILMLVALAAIGASTVLGAAISELLENAIAAIGL